MSLLQIKVFNSNIEAAFFAADMLTKILKTKPNAVLGLATGASPLALYKELINRHRQGEITFKSTTMFLLDEYLGLSDDHSQRFANCIAQVFTNYIDVNPAAVYSPNATATNHTEACIEYEHAIRQAGGVDFQILGIGSNGHIGFNEPGTSRESRTHVVELAEQTRGDNSFYFESNAHVPTHAVTQGIRTILDARSIVLLAFGAKKKDIIKRIVEEPVAEIAPASFLQNHSDVTVLLDEAAASELQGKL